MFRATEIWVGTPGGVRGTSMTSLSFPFWQRTNLQKSPRDIVFGGEKPAKHNMFVPSGD